MRTRFCTAVALLLAAPLARPAAPTTVAFQGMLKTPGGQPITSPAGGTSVVFSLYPAASGGTAAWTETQTVSAKAGLFTVALGSANPFGALAFDRPYWLGVRIAGEAAEMTPLVPLQAVPYALNAWSVGGNAGTNPSAQFLGTTDTQPLVLRVNNRRAGLWQDAVNAAGTARAPNVVGGASVNSARSPAFGVTIAGGGQEGLGGGVLSAPNEAWGNFAAIGGGAGNFTDAYNYATVAGGSGNIVQGTASTVGGGQGNNVQSANSVISGGTGNYTSAGNATIAGGDSNTASGQYSSVLGGKGNANSGPYATIAGGEANTSTGEHNFLGAGQRNMVGSWMNALGGGQDNAINTAFSFLGGGDNNVISDSWGVIGGGSHNLIQGQQGFIGGGAKNFISANGTWGSIPGGNENWVTGTDGSVGGGYQNTAGGWTSTVPGGDSNSATGLSSLAAGSHANAAHDGCFVWSDTSSSTFFGSTAKNQFCIRATGGMIFEAAGNPAIFTGVGTVEANRYVSLLNSPNAPSASGLKAGGVLCADSFDYANPAKSNMVVKGTLGVGYPNPAPYTFAVNGVAYAHDGYLSSDARLKTDVRTLDDALDTVAGLRGVTFEWNRAMPDVHGLPDGRRVGFIAQEVEKVLPEAVSTDGQGYKAVSYTSVVPVLVEAVKTLKQQNEDLQRRLAAVEDAMARLQPAHG